MHGFYIRWLLISHTHIWSKSGISISAFGYIERVVESDFFFGKDLFYIICAQHVLSYHLYKYHGGIVDGDSDKCAHV